jgi:O-antigen/teichoic acid export membrane protein
MAKDRPQRMGESMLDTAATSVAVTIITLVVGVVIARVLGPEGRGQYGAILFWGQFAGTTFTFSLYEALVLRLRARGESPETAVSLALLILTAIVGFTAIIAIGLQAAGVFDLPGVDAAIVLGFVLLVALSKFVNLAFVAIETAGLSFRRMNMERLISPTIFSIGVLSLYALGFASVSLVLFAFVASRLPITILRIYRYRRYLVGPVDFNLCSEVVRLAPSLFVATGAVSVAMQADRIFVTSLWSDEMLGYYFLAFSTVGAGLALSAQAIRMTLLPNLAGLSPTERRNKVERLVRLSIVATFFVSLPLFLIAPILIPIMYGEEYAVATEYVRAMILAKLVLPALQIVNIANRANERGWPGVEMGVLILLVYGVGFLLTGFETPMALFSTMFLAHILGIASGLRYLALDGNVRVGATLLPRPSDVYFLTSSATEYCRRVLIRTCSWGKERK